MKSNKLFYTKSEYIKAVMWHDGISRAEAARKVKEAIEGGIYGVLNHMVYCYHYVNSFTDPFRSYEARV